MTLPRSARFAILLALAATLPACAPTPVMPTDTLLDEILAPGTGPASADARAGFRRLFCSVLDARRPPGSDDAACEAYLRTIPPESGEIGPLPPLDEPEESFAILVVPGLGFNCFRNSDKDPEMVRFAASRGHVVRVAAVDGLEDTEDNAAVVAEEIARLDRESGERRVIVFSYSKGTNDTLEALASHAGIAERVTAVVGMGSAVGGSPLAERAPLWAANLLARIPGANCGPTPTGALQSLYPEVRQQWLAEHELPESVAYFSIVSLPLPDHVAPLLRVSYRQLGKFDFQNDGQVIARDQVIPGSTLLAFANADHWAIALPMSRFDGVDGSTYFSRDEFPMEVMIEAILRYVETVTKPATTTDHPVNAAGSALPSMHRPETCTRIPPEAVESSAEPYSGPEPAMKTCLTTSVSTPGNSD